MIYVIYAKVLISHRKDLNYEYPGESCFCFLIALPKIQHVLLLEMGSAPEIV